MSKISKTKITTGVFWLEVPEADLYILCGCPADVVKLMMKKGRKFMFGTGVMDGLSSLTIILMAVAGAVY